MSRDQLSLAARARKMGAAEGEGIVRCDACPVLCRIRPGRAGACARYANENGQLVRTDPVLLLERTIEEGGKVASFAGSEWDGAPLDPARTFVTGVGAGTTYPDYKPAPFIVSAEHDGRRHRHGRHRGDLLLLRRQGEDRHRSPPRPRDGAGPRQRRAGRPRDDDRIRLADAGDRRRAAPDRRLQEGGHRHLRHPARPVRGTPRGDGDRRRPRRHRAGGRGADRRWPAGGAHAGRLRIGRRGHLRQAMARPRRRGDRGRRPDHGRAHRAPGGPRARHGPGGHSRARSQVDARALLQGRQLRASAGAAPTSPSR